MMKLPWNKVEEKCAKALVNMKTFYDGKIKVEALEIHQKVMASIMQHKRSEQTKHNRLDARILRIERCFADQLKKFDKKEQKGIEKELERET